MSKAIESLSPADQAALKAALDPMFAEVVADGVGAVAADLATEIADRTSGDTAIGGRVDAAEAALSQTQGRPGDVLARFTSAITGDGAAAPAAAGVPSNTDDGGQVRLVTGAGIVALRERVALETGRIIRARFAVQRTVNPADPASATVRLAAQPLTKNKAALGSPRIVEDIALTVAGGLRIVTATFAFAGADFIWPATARYATFYVECFGADGSTAISLIDWEDVSGLAGVAADASAALLGEAAARSGADTALGSRATVIEQTHRVDLALDLKGWTRAQTQFSAADAPADAITALVATSKGKAIRLTGFAMLAKRSVSIVEPGVKYYLTFSFGRAVDDPADNNVLPRVACFDGAGTYLGLTLLPSQNIAASSAAVSLTVSVGDGTSGATYALLANTRYIRPYISGATSATTGAIDLYRITDPSPVDRSDITAISAAVAGVPYLPRNTDVSSFQGKVGFWDFRGILGTARALYLPRSFFARKGAAGSNILQSNIGAESAIMAGFVMLQVPTAGSAYYIYFDATDNSYKVAIYSGLPIEGANIWPICIIHGAAISWSNYDIQRIEGNWQFRMSKPIIVENGGVVRVPKLAADSGYFSYETADKYREMPAFGLGASAQALCFSPALAAAAEAAWLTEHTGDIAGGKEAGAAAGFFVATNPNWPDSAAAKVLAHGFQGQITPVGGIAAVGAVPGGSTPNVMGIGKNEIEKALIFSGGVVVDVTDPNALALGFTRALVSAVEDPANRRAYYGCNFASAISFGQLPFRCTVVSDVDNDFPTPRAYGFRASGGTVLLGQGTMEKQHGPRCASFLIQGAVPALETLTGAWIGIDYPGRQCQIMGNQIGTARPGPTYIFPDDFTVAVVAGSTYTPPASVDLLLPPQMYVIEGRGLPFHIEQVIELQTEGLGLTVACEAINVSKGRLPITDPKRLFDGSFGGEARFVGRTAVGDQALHRLLPVMINKAPADALVGKTIPLMIIGDSLSATYGLAPAIKEKLEYLGAVVQMIGTLTADDRTLTGGAASRSTKGEGRGSRKASDFTNASTGAQKLMTPIVDMLSYLALANGNRIPLNPMARPEEAGDLAAHVCNGHIFDLGWYRAQLAAAGQPQPAPRYVLLVLGTNDEGTYPAPEDENSVYDNLKIMVERIWADDPTTEIGITLETNSWSAVGFTRWVNEKRHGNKRKLQLIREKASPRLAGISLMAHQNRHAGWIYEPTTGVANPVTGVIEARCTDPHHEHFIGAEEMAEPIVAWIAAREAARAAA